MTTNSSARKPVILMPSVSTCILGADPALTVLIDDLGARLIKAVEAAGGQVVIYDHSTASDMAAAIEGCDGVLLPGGGDVDPTLYGDTTRHPELYNVDIDMDRAAVKLAQQAKEAGKPILAICRGLHILNVAHGGTLVQHMMPSSVTHRGGGPEGPMIDHPVTIDQGTLLAGILNKTQASVRSGHHQAINTLGNCLTVIARADDGCVEAITGEDDQMLGIQWHPEEAGGDIQDQHALFAWLVDAARSAKRVSKETSEAVK
jgi:putative glutamine amidotransferase